MIIGISGPIASGKSTVAQIIQSQTNGTIIDADQVAHQLYEPQNSGWKLIKEYFPSTINPQDQKVNRQQLADIVFNDPQKLAQLNQLIHPLITQQIHKQIKDQNLPRPIIIEAFEFTPENLGPLVNKVIYISTTPENCIKNAQQNRNITLEQMKKILDHQGPPTLPDILIDNNNSLESLKNKVSDTINYLKLNS